MFPDGLYPIAEAEKLVNGFLECALPKTAWTHEAHLITGLYLLAHFDTQTLPEMRQRLKRYNESMGGINDDQNGYHETLTVYWLTVLKNNFTDRNGKIYWHQQNLDALMLDEKLADKNSWLEFYSKERMMSVEARRSFLLPDLMEMAALGAYSV